jgi:pantoate--beta-alanine ligase
MKVVDTFEAARELLEGSVGLVPTMGFLHEGHLSLIEASVARAETTVVTVFVNPLQFDDGGDLDDYPRDLERDIRLAADAGASVLVAPTRDYMYPTRPRTSVMVDEVGDAMEGARRPGHFIGVATVVTKLFAGTDPDLAFFGRKDAQQLALVSTLASDLSFKVDIVGCPVIREHDGLALSSRNLRLSDDERRAATSLSAGLMQAALLVETGVVDVAEIVGAARRMADATDGVQVEYAELADAHSAVPAGELAGRRFLAIAARIGDVRLIDSITIEDGAVDRGVPLDHPSILYGGA